MICNSNVLKALSFFALMSITACSTNNAINSPTNQKNTSYSTTALNLKSLQSINAITPQLAKHRVVFVGEQHTQYSDHLNQLAIIKNLHKRWGENTSIGLEMIQQPYQSVLDDYITGRINEHEMLKNTQWFDRWRYDFRLYQPIFSYAKANNIPLVALNIPKELTQKITKVGIKGLSKKERQQLPAVIDRSSKAYTKRITSVFSKHSHTSSKGIAKFLDAQLAWDEGMAFAAAKYLKKNPVKRMVIIAGGGHVINRSGIPNRLDRQINSRSAVVLNNVGETPSATQGDFLLFSPEKKLPTKGMMGILMANGKNGVTVNSTVFHSTAAKAGVLKGDVIVAIDGQVIQSSADVKIWGFDKKPDDAVKLKLRRKNKIIFKELILKGKSLVNPHKLSK
ncbi:MAG: ChaN family lipoprotein [Cocleimonas sp.]|nr:ChaN family lipoprotein [Cocleimonas sp.]